MPYLVDTNLLLRSADAGSPQQEVALREVASLRLQGESVPITAQNLVEFWAVATRPAERNGLGMTVEAAEAELLRLVGFFPVLAETPAIYLEWQRLVVAHRIVGLRVYDARLVAVMLANEIDHVLTFNVDDFRSYPEITVIHPQEAV